MLVCDICTQEVSCEDDMKSHLLLAHMEQDCCCPFCSVSGLTYDELSSHIHTAHADTLEPWSSEEEPCEDVREDMTSSASSSNCTPDEELSTADYKVTAEECKVPLDVERINNKTESSCKEEYISRNADTVSSIPASEDSELGSALVIHNSAPPTATATHIAGSDDLVVECPFCGEVKNSIDKLELHVRMDHADLLASPTKGIGVQQYECPMCSLVCANGNILQEHVNLHLEENYDTGKITSDTVLARQLQAEEDTRRRVEESEREKAEFQELQRQFGLDNSGGYRQQSVQNLERAVARGRMHPMEFHLQKSKMMESLATGVDDGRTKTSGVLGALRQYYNNAGSEVRRVWLCSPLDHFSNSAGDKGWGCGFRNFQMLLSSALLDDTYKDLLQDYRSIPCIPKIQALIEDAWKEGFDPQGASHFNGKLRGTRAWIGACEIYCLLTTLRLKCRLLDFHTPSGPSGTHPLLFEWVLNYFASDTRGTEGNVVCCSKPAIYLQHQGHSRTIVGIEERKNKSYCLLLFDPGCPSETMRRITRQNVDAADLKHFRKYIGGLKHKQYQIVAVEGILSPEEKAVRLQMSKVFQAERIP
ncbi:zinc finger-containing ubiquitin peptidase 1 [Hyla sarda]|uniref:zinc finger-containing ubiquitin peptidase 1 n=1 Tax=Hyla sarda TaxID=327740 RepID=UPI0024C2E8BE|nr:zinc finger-containing ubiquitin peptidase 1 [Hyla sarda]XP_056422367.1 zinc finger-containing ubiquitin peptidase 1 [Hyla sarda]XP_056422368.1 zinc finger-containing ubiquitin peptidase 1 [Hyla sarda]XP_056422370.1 zinc finger-containing ubiquitin peptidase 1 [Hyla sarda]XP_056422371.1 zinc finger-containing ubiquitin peptidase 1 [Hyla sarda]XP_056422372.1 zinc finger-containing ubiquitin peptidase 1 [Hyla sarda]